jgi:hypothetical protein
MADIFLSYAEEDRETAGRIARLLEAQGWSVWWDRRIPGGKTWREVIQLALQDMRCMVVLWSRSSVTSFWVNEEAEEGRMRQQLMPILIERVVPPIGFRGVQAIDLVDWDGSPEAPSVRQLIGDVTPLLTKTPVPGMSSPAATGSDPAASFPRKERRVASSTPQGPNGEMAAKRKRVAFWLLAPTILIALIFGFRLLQGLDFGTKAKLVPDPVWTATPAEEGKGEQPAKAAGGEVLATPAATDKPPIRSAHEAKSVRCGDIQQKQSIGEPLTADERAYLKKEC